MRKAQIWSSVALFAVGWMAGCGGGGGGGSSSGGEGVITETRRDAVLTAAAAKYKTLLALDSNTANQQMADYLKKLPEFEAVGISEDHNVWARFPDGRLSLYVNNRKPIPRSARTAPPPSTRARRSRSADKPSDIPMSKTVILSETLGSLFGYPVTDVMMLVEDKGYDTDDQNTVDGLKTVTGAGVFYYDGHGGSGEAKDGTYVYGVWTFTPRTPANDLKYKDDLDSRALVYMTAVYDEDAAGQPILSERYAFTRYFVKQYMSFSSNSFVFIDACSSARNAGFSQAFYAKNATVYAGWSDTADASSTKPAALKLFDRLLGTNSPDAGKESPDQRPFDWPAVFAWMRENKLDYGSADGSCRLLITKGSGSSLPFGVLAPSIAFVWAHEYEEKLYLYGIFGTNPGGEGKLTVNGTPLQIQEWAYDGQTSMDRIVAKLPYQGAGSAGDVQVTVRDHKSNIRQLSMYKGWFKITHSGGGSRKVTLDHYLRLRVDLQSLRMKPAETPKLKPMNPQRIFADMQSYVDFEASGVEVFPDGGSITWSGKDTLLNNVDGSGNTRGFIASMKFDPEQNQYKLSLTGVVDKGLIVTARDKDGRVTTANFTIIFGIDEFDGKDANDAAFPSDLIVPVDSSYNISKGSKTATKLNAFYENPKTETMKVEWDPITCEYPPKEDAARSVR